MGWDLSSFAASARRLRAVATLLIGLTLILQEVGFALVVAIVIWTVFEYFSRTENEAIWKERIDSTAQNMLYAVLRKDLPSDEFGRGASDGHCSAARRISCYSNQGHRAPEAGGLGDLAAVSECVPHREGPCAGGTRACPPQARRRPASCGRRSRRSRRGRCRGNGTSRLRCHAESLCPVSQVTCQVIGAGLRGAFERCEGTQCGPMATGRTR